VKKIFAGVSSRRLLVRQHGETRITAGLTNRRRLQMSVSVLFDDVTVETANTPNPVVAAFSAAARAVAAWRAERARRLDLDDLLRMGPHRLRDIGLSVDDVRQAMLR
jgi:uncharacterized protein YjiS (DUF1127 family)